MNRRLLADAASNSKPNTIKATWSSMTHEEREECTQWNGEETRCTHQRTKWNWLFKIVCVAIFWTVSNYGRSCVVICPSKTELNVRHDVEKAHFLGNFRSSYSLFLWLLRQIKHAYVCIHWRCLLIVWYSRIFRVCTTMQSHAMLLLSRHGTHRRRN